MPASPIQLSDTWFDAREGERISAALQGRVAGNGPFCRKVEDRLAQLLGGGRVLLTTSCTHAMELALLALGIGAGQEVVCPSFTFVSTANAILRVGARPVFADIEDQTLGLDPADVERRLGPRTAALLPVHYAGIAPDMDRLLALSGPAPRHPGGGRLLQLSRDQERDLRRGRSPRRPRSGPGRPGRGDPREGHQPQRLPARGGRQVHVGGRRQQLRAVRRARRDARRAARQARGDPGPPGAGRRTLPRGAVLVGGRPGRAVVAAARGPARERSPLLRAAAGSVHPRPLPGPPAGPGGHGGLPLRAPPFFAPRPQAGASGGASGHRPGGGQPAAPARPASRPASSCACPSTPGSPRRTSTASSAR